MSDDEVYEDKNEERLERIADVNEARLNQKLENLSRHNYQHGHAFTAPPRATKIKAMKCYFCNGNAIARAMCCICATPLCKRHTITQDGQTYCKHHKQGWL